jgi:hypothetical protein
LAAAGGGGGGVAGGAAGGGGGGGGGEAAGAAALAGAASLLLLLPLQACAEEELLPLLLSDSRGLGAGGVTFFSLEALKLAMADSICWGLEETWYCACTLLPPPVLSPSLSAPAILCQWGPETTGVKLNLVAHGCSGQYSGQ